MRERDRPAAPNNQDGSDFDGLTKFEATAMNQMAAYRYGYSRGQLPPLEAASMAVEDASALWDEIEREDRDDG